MVTKAGLRREQRKEQSRINNGIATASAIVIGLLLFVLPRTALWMTSDLILAWLVLLFCAWYCWGWYPTWGRRLGFAALHATALFAIGYTYWPRIKITPEKASYAGRDQEHYDFTVSNETDETKMSVLVPIDVVGQPKGNFDLIAWPSERPASSNPQRGVRFWYCTPKRGTYIAAYFPTMLPHEVAHFSLIHKGPRLEAQVQPALDSPGSVPYEKEIDSSGHLQESSYVEIPKEYFPCQVVLGDIKR